MSGLRLLFGTKQAAFVLASDGAGKRWEVKGMPAAVAQGRQPLLIVGAIAGG